MLPRAVSRQPGEGQAPHPTIQATEPPRVRAMPTAAPHQPGRSPASPRVRALALPAPRPSPQRREASPEAPGPNDSSEHQAPSGREVDGSETCWPGGRQWPQKGSGWAGSSCRPRKPSRVSGQQRQPGNPHVPQTLMQGTQHRGALPSCAPRELPDAAPPASWSQRAMCPCPPSKKPWCWESRGQERTEALLQGPGGAGSEATRLHLQACAPPMPHPHPTADTVPLVGWPDARWAALHAEHVHSGLCGAEEPAEAQEGAHGHGRRCPPILGQSVGHVWDGHGLCLGLGLLGGLRKPHLRQGRRDPQQKA